jgi:hypothetical protein
MGFGDKMTIGAYTLVCESYTQDDNSNYGSEWGVMNVFKGGKQIATLNPERRFYKASQQTSTMVANRSTPQEDLYVVYEGQNPETGKPIIKVHLNPLVMWIWVGVWIMIAGTILALVPNSAPCPYRQRLVCTPSRLERETDSREIEESLTTPCNCGPYISRMVCAVSTVASTTYALTKKAHFSQTMRKAG